MRIPDKLKLNRFRYVPVPDCKDVFARFGRREVPASVYTGDELAPHAQTKLDSIREADANFRDFLDNDDARPEGPDMSQ